MNQSAIESLVEEVVTVYRRDDPKADTKVTEQENLKVIQELYGAFMRRDIDALLDGLDEQVEWNIAGPAEVPFTGAVRGREQVRKVLEKSFATVDQQEPEIRQVLARGDTVTVRGFERGTHQPSGERYETTWLHVFTLSGGKVVKFHEEFDHAPILEAMRAAKS